MGAPPGAILKQGFVAGTRSHRGTHATPSVLPRGDASMEKRKGISTAPHVSGCAPLVHPMGFQLRLTNFHARRTVDVGRSLLVRRVLFSMSYTNMAILISNNCHTGKTWYISLSSLFLSLSPYSSFATSKLTFCLSNIY